MESQSSGKEDVWEDRLSEHELRVYMCHCVSLGMLVSSVFVSSLSLSIHIYTHVYTYLYLFVYIYIYIYTYTHM